LLNRYPLWQALIGLGLFLFVGFHWKEQPLFLRQGLTMLIPLVGLGLMWGYLDELRGYYEVYPIIVALMTKPVAFFLGFEMDNSKPPDAA
jgi:hypothetical protein